MYSPVNLEQGPLKISIILPAFNEEKLITLSLQAVKRARVAFEKRGWETEIVVCDNNSTDQTATMARAEGARVVFEPINQIARARNSGAAVALGDWFIFVDADSFPSEELFNDVAKAINDGKILGGGCIIKMDEKHFIPGALVELWNLASRLRKWAAGSFIYCKATAFREIGGFSNDLFASEEIDFSNRLKLHARQRQMRLKILTAHPLVTSARKLHLYSTREHWRFLRRLFIRPGKILRNRDACHTWYDGRR